MGAVWRLTGAATTRKTAIPTATGAHRRAVRLLRRTRGSECSGATGVIPDFGPDGRRILRGSVAGSVDQFVNAYLLPPYLCRRGPGIPGIISLRSHGVFPLPQIKLLAEGRFEGKPGPAGRTWGCGCLIDRGTEKPLGNAASCVTLRTFRNGRRAIQALKRDEQNRAGPSA